MHDIENSPRSISRTEIIEELQQRVDRIYNTYIGDDPAKAQVLREYADTAVKTARHVRNDRFASTGIMLSGAAALALTGVMTEGGAAVFFTILTVPTAVLAGISLEVAARSSVLVRASVLARDRIYARTGGKESAPPS